MNHAAEKMNLPNDVAVPRRALQRLRRSNDEECETMKSGVEKEKEEIAIFSTLLNEALGDRRGGGGGGGGVVAEDDETEIENQISLEMSEGDCSDSIVPVLEPLNHDNDNEDDVFSKRLHESISNRKPDAETNKRQRIVKSGKTFFENKTLYETIFGVNRYEETKLQDGSLIYHDVILWDDLSDIDARLKCGAKIDEIQCSQTGSEEMRLRIGATTSIVLKPNILCYNVEVQESDELPSSPKPLPSTSEPLLPSVSSSLPPSVQQTTENKSTHRIPIVVSREYDESLGAFIDQRCDVSDSNQKEQFGKLRQAFSNFNRNIGKRFRVDNGTFKQAMVNRGFVPRRYLVIGKGMYTGYYGIRLISNDCVSTSQQQMHSSDLLPLLTITPPTPPKIIIIISPPVSPPNSPVIHEEQSLKRKQTEIESNFDATPSVHVGPPTLAFRAESVIIPKPTILMSEGRKSWESELPQNTATDNANPIPLVTNDIVHVASDTGPKPSDGDVLSPSQLASAIIQTPLSVTNSTTSKPVASDCIIDSVRVVPQEKLPLPSILLTMKQIDSRLQPQIQPLIRKNPPAILPYRPSGFFRWITNCFGSFHASFLDDRCRQDQMVNCYYSWCNSHPNYVTQDDPTTNVRFWTLVGKIIIKNPSAHRKSVKYYQLENLQYVQRTTGIVLLCNRLELEVNFLNAVLEKTGYDGLFGIDDLIDRDEHYICPCEHSISYQTRRPDSFVRTPTSFSSTLRLPSNLNQLVRNPITTSTNFALISPSVLPPPRQPISNVSEIPSDINTNALDITISPITSTVSPTSDATLVPQIVTQDVSTSVPPTSTPPPPPPPPPQSTFLIDHLSSHENTVPISVVAPKIHHRRFKSIHIKHAFELLVPRYAKPVHNFLKFLKHREEGITTQDVWAGLRIHSSVAAVGKVIDYLKTLTPKELALWESRPKEKVAPTNESSTTIVNDPLTVLPLSASTLPLTITQVCNTANGHQIKKKNLNASTSEIAAQKEHSTSSPSLGASSLHKYNVLLKHMASDRQIVFPTPECAMISSSYYWIVAAFWCVKKFIFGHLGSKESVYSNYVSWCLRNPQYLRSKFQCNREEFWNKIEKIICDAESRVETFSYDDDLCKFKSQYDMRESFTSVVGKTPEFLAEFMRPPTADS